MTGSGAYRSDLQGQLLNGRYRVRSVLGKGGMGTVYLAEDEHLDGRQVVVKVPRPEFLTEPGFRERFRREIRSLTQLEHPHIVKT